MTATAASDPYFLLVTVDERGHIRWTVAQRSNMDWAEPLEEGPYLLGAEAETQYIVTPETVGVTDDMIRVWAEADDEFWRYCRGCGSRMSDREEAKAGSYELAANEAAKPITTALQAAYEALVQAKAAAE